ncbi:MAG: dTDP-4-dehydrorhamnose reductase [bacterium]|nr:dTDP-4-dehydrorhamnose reductase [bacterium]
MKFYLAGSKGMLASDLSLMLEECGELISRDLPGMDISDIDSVRSDMRAAGPDIVINCAAYTAVDKAEEEEPACHAVNAIGPGNLAAVCKEMGIRLIHISTDFVFDGLGNRPYAEKDDAAPISVYGKTKLAGESLIRQEMDDYLIVRTSWLYGRHGNNFVKTVARLAAERDNLGIVYDQTGTPTYTKDLAQGIINLISVKAEPGIYHFSNEGVCSWYDFAYEIIRMMQLRGEPLKLKELNPILSREYPTAAARPPYSVMDKGKYKRTTNQAIPHWRDGLIRYFEEEV